MIPTTEEARAALTEAGSQASAVRRADRQLRLILVVVAATYVLLAGVMSSLPVRGSGLGDVVLLAFGLVAVGAIVVVGVRIRAYSRAGIRWYFGGMIVFNVWNAAVSGFSIASGFWATSQPNSDFLVSALVAVIPLIVVAGVMERR